MRTARTFIYVDGLNQYYGALKYTLYKWLNIDAMCRQLLRPYNEIVKIKYYTARVTAYPDDPGKPQGQNTYFRALQAEAVGIVTQDIQKAVGIINPQDGFASVTLAQYASFVKAIRSPNLLKACQFPDQIADAVGVFNKPTEWNILKPKPEWKKRRSKRK